MSAAVQTVWAELCVASLADAGVTELVVSPGSRSTPLVAAAAALPGLTLYPVIDERAAGFFALGRARAGGAPVAVVCTSGTAPAHYLPAVIEAAMSGVPLVVVSADRPPELHGAGAAQTIDQTRLFGGFVRRFEELGPADGSPLALRALRRKLGQAVAAARGPAPGPVHVNVALREPLEPAPPGPPLRAAAEASRQLRRVAVAPARAHPSGFRTTAHRPGGRARGRRPPRRILATRRPTASCRARPRRRLRPGDRRAPAGALLARGPAASSASRRGLGVAAVDRFALAAAALAPDQRPT
ncbi:MAG: hypothetical protein HS111_02935 [Kofleriaceae bacterium]|nr:hypothetical protein [Kofleriaceae bacterium]